jgi:hypothetical protein
MSKTRRFICILTGLLIIAIGVLFGWTSDFLSGRVGNPYSVETAMQLIEDMESRGATFEDVDAAESLAFEVVYREVRRQSDAGMFYMFALCGLAPIVFGVFPSRKSESN